ncbi:replication factor A protein, partial [Trifolium medium]|nr:replication factor A protein [Trifolium medium]
VIGVMAEISAEREYVRDGKITKMVIVELTDHSGKGECALFGDYVDELNKKMGNSASGLPIVIVQFAKTRHLSKMLSIPQGFWLIQIFSKLKFKNSIALHGIESDTTVPLTGVKRICVDPIIIQAFCSQGAFSTPTKTMSDAIDLDSDGLSNDTEVGEDSHSLEFVNDTEGESDVAMTVKRNLSKVFDGVAMVEAKIPLKKVKIEKE